MVETDHQEGEGLLAEAIVDDQEAPSQGSIPSVEDLLLGSGPRQGDLLREMMTGSGDEAVFFPRTRISDEEIQREMRMELRRNQWRRGCSHPEDLRALKYNARIGLEGQARREAVAVMGGAERLGRPWGRRGPSDGVLSRARTLNRGEEITPRD